jgi:hypothetical protein
MVGDGLGNLDGGCGGSDCFDDFGNHLAFLEDQFTTKRTALGTIFNQAYNLGKRAIAPV